MPVSEPVFPIHLVLRNQPCLVVGGGRIALRKTRELINAGAVVSVVSPAFLADFEDLDIATHKRRYQLEDLNNQRLVFAATSDRQVNHQIYLDAESANIWANSVDDPDNCSFITPGIVREGPITVSVSTAGRSPAISRWLRRQIQQLLANHGAPLLKRAEEKRIEIHSAGLSSEDFDWDTFLKAKS